MINDTKVLTNTDLELVNDALFNRFEARLYVRRNEGFATFNDIVFRHYYQIEFKLVDNCWKLTSLELTKFVPLPDYLDI
jgi:hypothetical protein